MKKAILFCLGTLFYAHLFISCNNDDINDDFIIRMDPKEDIELEGADLATVQKALQGTWNVIKEDYPGDPGMVIVNNKIIFFEEKSGRYIATTEWKDIIWVETTLDDGRRFYSFTPVYDNPERTTPMFRTVFRIKNGVLITGVNPTQYPEGDKRYLLLTNKQD